MRQIPLIVAFLFLVAPAYAQVDLGTSASSTNPQRSGDATTGLFSSTADAVSVSSGGIEMMRVNGTGVGIGTTSPNYNLTVVNSSGATNESVVGAVGNTSGLVYMDLYNSNTGTTGNGTIIRLITEDSAGTGLAVADLVKYANGGLYLDNSDSAGTISFGNGTNGTQMVLNTAGDLGIGTTSPVSSLDLSQQTDAVALPSGTTSQRPGSPVNGEIRYNSSTSGLEAYVNGAWVSLGGSPGASTSSAGHLQCSGSNCSNSTGSGTIQYCPYKGNVKTTASQGNYSIPSGCLTATLTSMYVGGTASSSVAASTLYYIYLWNTSGTWVLDAETTGHVTDSSSGIEIMSGDNTKTLIGMIHTDANKHVMTDGETSTAGDTNTVATWDNRKPTLTSCQFTTTRTVTLTYLTEINSENRCNFMSWGDAMIASSQQLVTQTVSGIPGYVQTEIDYDTSNSNNIVFSVVVPAGTGLSYYLQAIAPSGIASPPEGFHYTVMIGAVNTGGGTATYDALQQTQTYTVQ